MDQSVLQEELGRPKGAYDRPRNEVIEFGSEGLDDEDDEYDEDYDDEEGYDYGETEPDNSEVTQNQIIEENGYTQYSSNIKTNEKMPFC